MAAMYCSNCSSVLNSYTVLEQCYICNSSSIKEINTYQLGGIDEAVDSTGILETKQDLEPAPVDLQEPPKQEKALRFNSGKIEMSQQPYRAWAAFSTVCMLNSQKYYGKYPDGNYRKCAPQSEYMNAISRHFALHMTGEIIDPEDGAAHMWKVLWNAAMSIETSFLHPENDDLPKLEPIDFTPFKELVKTMMEKRKKE